MSLSRTQVILLLSASCVAIILAWLVITSNTNTDISSVDEPDQSLKESFSALQSKEDVVPGLENNVSLAVQPVDNGSPPSDLACSEEDGIGESCNARDVSLFGLFDSHSSAVAYWQEDSVTVEEVLENGLRSAGASPVQLVVRGTATGASIRCDWRGIARTPGQREEAIRYWLGLGEEAIPPTTLVEALFTITLDTLAPQFSETAKSNFLSIVHGGLSTDYLYLACYADYTTQEYLLGAGPTSLTLAYDRMGEAHSYPLYRLEHEAGSFSDDPLMSEGEYQAQMDALVQQAETTLAGMVANREAVLFLAPMGAHNAIAVEAWQGVAQWDLQRDEEGVVHAVRYGAAEGDPEYTQTLANLKSRITAATTPSDGASGSSTTSPQPTRITNASGLTQYYRDIGAYGDITPDDGSTETFTPSQPPPVYACAGGTAASDAATNRGLLHDCEALLDGKDTLRGTGSLNWATSSSLSSWDGITTAGTPGRVTRLELANESLSGSIPSSLGSLFELTHLDLSRNSLTGEIPHELGWLYNLEELRLSGNALTGCIPLALKDVATSDLSSLNLLYCQPPAPENLRAGTTGESVVRLNWNAVSNTDRYRVEYRLRGTGDWTVDDDAVAGASHTVDELECESEYQFRVSAHGSGTVYAAEWSDPSSPASATTGDCPEFRDGSYRFQVGENVLLGRSVGRVSATGPGGGTTTYAITAGNGRGDFAIDPQTGEITVVEYLDYETVPSYELTVEASSRNGGMVEVVVEITVVNFNSLAPPARRFSVTLEGEVFSMTWEAVPNAVRYAAQYRIPGVQERARDIRPFPSDTRLEFRPPVGPLCGRTYEFSLWAYGDGETYDAKFGRRTDFVQVETPACNIPPRFEQSTYSFSVSEDASVGAAVGAVVASDPDESGDVVHTITAGNEDGKFAIDEDTGEMTVDGTLDHGTTPAYTLTVEASDGEDASTARVEIAVIPPLTASFQDAPESHEGQPFEFRLSLSEPIRISYRTILDHSLAASGGEVTAVWRVEGRGDLWGIRVAPGGSGGVTVTLEGNRPCNVVGAICGVRGNRLANSLRLHVPGPRGDNRLPVFTEGDSATRSIPENISTGTSVGAPLTATDQDGDTLTYTLTGDDAASFDIDADTGQLSVREGVAYDYEARSTYSVTVRVSDGSGSSSIAVTVNLTDVNDPPVYDEGDGATRSIPENSPAGTGVGAPLTATDQDGDTLIYTLSGDDAESFDIEASTGQLSAREGVPYDYETKATYSVTVQVSDGSGSSSIAVTVNLTDVNDPPVFDESGSATRSIPENSPAGTSVGAPLSATDQDGDALTYTLLGDVDDGASFDIDADTGQLSAREGVAYDYETKSTYSVTVQVSDGHGNGSTSIVVTVNLTDANDPPIFDEGDSATRSIPENSPAGTGVGAPLSATDQDGDTLTYTLPGDDAASFDIEASTGQLMAREGVVYDYETRSTYSVTVQVSDGNGGSSSIAVTVNLTDVDETPATACFTDLPSLTEVAWYSGAWDDAACRSHHRADSMARYFHFTLTAETTVTVSLIGSGTLFVSRDTPQKGWGAVPAGTYEDRIRVRLANGKLVSSGGTATTLTLAPGVTYTVEVAATTGGGSFTLSINPQ